MRTHQQRIIGAERTNAAGEVLLSHNHIALLHGLYDRPNGFARSHNEWAHASIPYLKRFRANVYLSSLIAAISSIKSSWVTEKRTGKGIEATLTDRGRAIVEREVPSRIYNYGSYYGIAPGNRVVGPSRVIHLPENELARIVDFSDTFCLPLLEPSKSNRRTTQIFAVSKGIGEPFRLISEEEAELRGPRSWHLNWTRQMIQAHKIPPGYAAFFAGCDMDDVLSHLQELCHAHDDVGRYIEAYRPGLFLSHKLNRRWMDERINFLDTDFDPDALQEYIRRSSTSYARALESIKGQRLVWTSQASGKRIGIAAKRRSAQSDREELWVSGPAALACLQRYWDNEGTGLEIEVRYVPD